MKEKTKKYLTLFFKVTVSAALLFLLITRIDLEKFITVSRQFSAWSIIPLTVLFIGTVFIGSWRWKIFLDAHGMNQGIFKGTKLYLVGYFFNNFLPSGVGGDVVRGYSCGKESGKVSEAYASIAAERLAGILATMLIALVFLPIVHPPSPLPLAILLINLALWTGTILFIILETDRIIRIILGKLPFGMGDKIADFVKAIRHFRNDKIVLLKGLLLSIIYQGSLIGFVYFVARLAGVSKIPVAPYFVFTPLIWIISLIPISLNALGIREASFSYFFSIWGASEAEGLLVSLVFWGCSLIAGVIGGVIWAFSGYKEKSRGNDEKCFNSNKFE